MEFLTSMWNTFERVKNVWVSVGEFLSYNTMLKEDMQVLTTKLEDLSSRERDINTELQSLEHQSGNKRKRDQVDNWLRNVKRKKYEVEQREQEVRKRSYLSRWQQRRLVQKDIKEVAELVEQGRFPEGLVLTDVNQSKGEELSTTPLTVHTTANQNLEKIWGCLMNEETLSIGVYGMGGVGKTTIVTDVHDKLLKDASTFDHVYWVTVSQQSSIYKLQNDIANAVQLDLLGEENEKKRAAKLSKWLKRRKKFVLILDDMWDVFPKEKLGVPLGVNRGKLMLTTRKHQVCHGMNCQEVVKVEPLSEQESWGLFVGELGLERVHAPPLERIARCVAEECGGLPLAIVAVARSLRGVAEVSDWRNALHDLKEPGKGSNNMEKEVFELLKFSYDRLGDETLQKCLLYCSLFPEDYAIKRSDLIVCWIGEGLIDEMGSLQAEFDRGNAIINRLIDACLLESADADYVKMHDVIRDMALTIASVFMVKAGVQLRDFPSKREWLRNLVRVSLMRNSLGGCCPGFSPNCPKLKTLFLQVNYHLKKLPNCFFIKMQSLTVLNLSESELERLPDSISNLLKLRVLLLRDCRRLKYIPSLAKLGNLQILDLSESGIQWLPNSISNLEKLRVLHLTNCRKLKGVKGISYYAELQSFQCLELQNLQCLTVMDLSNTLIDRLPDSLSDLAKLRVLLLRHCTHLQHIPSLAKLENLQELDLCFSGVEELPNGIESLVNLRVLDLSETPIQGLIPSAVLQKLSHLQILRLWCCDVEFLPEALVSLGELETLQVNFSEIHSFNSYVRTQHWQRLSQCTISTGFSYSSIEFTTIVHHKGVIIRNQKDPFFLPNDVDYLDIGDCYDGTSLVLDDVVDVNNLPMFTIYGGVLDNLQVLHIRGCRQLKHFVSPSLARHLFGNLTTLRVWGCKNLEEIIAMEDQSFDQSSSSSHDNIVVPKLQHLDLGLLPKLKSIYRGAMVCHSLGRIEVRQCPMLKKLPFSVQQDDQHASLLPWALLKEIKGARKWWDSLEWDHLDAKSIWDPFFRADGFLDDTSEDSLE